MKVQSFSKDICNEVMKDVKSAILEVLKNYGLSAEFDGGKFDAERFIPKINIVITNNDGSTTSVYEKDFKQYAHMVGLKSDDFNKTFTYNGQKYNISGLKLKSRKFPVIAYNTITKKSYKFDANVVKKLLS